MVKRILRHLLVGEMKLRRAFPERTLSAIERAIRESESGHRGEICFAVEAALPLPALLRNTSARERAIEVFAELRVWDTEANSGVLIYLLLADHDVEIVADRGISAHVEHAHWEAICNDMEAAFRAGRFEVGVVTAMEKIGALIGQHFPLAPGANELPDRPVLL